MKKGLFAKKSVASLLKEASHEKGLQRALGPFNLIAIGIGAIIGAGLFVLTGEAAASAAGPAVVISFFIAALVCSFAALCYAEFASMIPVAGSAYLYGYVALGEFFAWIMGLALTIYYLFSCCTVAVGWSAYLNSLLQDLGLSLPDSIAKAPLAYSPQLGLTPTESFINLPAIFIIGLIGWLVARGVQTAAMLNNLLVFVKIGIILLFIGCGLAYIQTGNLSPFIPQNTGVFGEFGWSGIFRGAGIVFFGYLGFDSVSTLAQEAKNPQRSMPIGMIGSLAICAALYIVFGFVLTGTANYTTLGVENSIAVAVRAFGPHFAWLRYVVNIAILSGLTSVILVMLMGQARIFYAIAHDGLLPKLFGRIHSKHHTPFLATIAVMILGIILSGFFPISIVGPLSSMGALLSFGMVCFGVLLLRYTQPKLDRPFKTPWFPLVPLLGTLSCLTLMVLMPSVIWMQFGTLLVFWCALYFLYGRKNSKVRQG